MPGKLYIKTHGCQMNEYDSDRMAEVLAASHGLELTDDAADADARSAKRPRKRCFRSSAIGGR